MAEQTTWFKVLTTDGRSAHGGDYTWPLPTDDAPGAWTPAVAPVICRQGYHLTRRPMDWPLVGMRVFLAEGDGTRASNHDLDSKTAFARARLLREVPEVVPDWWRAVERFVTEEIPAVRWLRPDSDPDPDWLLVERHTWTAAWDAAWDAAWTAARAAARDATWTAARDAARDARLMAAILVCDGLPLDPLHVAHAKARWRVWQKGYALLGDIDCRLVVYAARSAP